MIWVTNHMRIFLSCALTSRKYLEQIKLLFFRFGYFRLPFNIRTPFGYLIYTILTYGSLYCILFNSVPASCFLIGCTRLFICFGNDVRNDLLLLNASGKRRKNSIGVKQRFLKILQTYADAKELSMGFSETLLKYYA